jgi:small subunit ribosomal protein S8e
MTQWQLRSKRKKTGGLLKKHSKKKRHQRGRDYVPTHLGEPRKAGRRTRGGRKKTLAFSTNVANIVADGKSRKAKILSVVENPADAQFVRRNIITKNAVIDTEIGLARVTSRPGQQGFVNAVLIKKKE